VNSQIPLWVWDGMEVEVQSPRQPTLNSCCELVSHVDVPSAPTNLRAGPVSADSVTLDWTKPRSDGGSALTGYAIERRDTTSNYWTRVATVDQRKTSYTVTGLRPGVEYQLQVLAENDIGISDPSLLPGTVRIPAPTTAAARSYCLSYLLAQLVPAQLSLAYSGSLDVCLSAYVC